MRPRSLSEIARAVDGSLHGDDTVASSVVIDSRLAGPGALFVALAGERADGHAFVGDALSRGAAGAVVERQPADELTIDEVRRYSRHLIIPDVGMTGQKRLKNAKVLVIAADERRAMTGVTLIAITGANGKTSTKDLAASVLSTRMPTHASPASFNNEIGLPLTLLGAPADSEVIVAEMGARREGDVAALCRIARPDIVVVTNLGVAHMEIFGSWDAIVRSGAEPLAALGADDVAILLAIRFAPADPQHAGGRCIHDPAGGDHDAVDFARRGDRHRATLDDVFAHARRVALQRVTETASRGPENGVNVAGLLQEVLLTQLQRNFLAFHVGDVGGHLACGHALENIGALLEPVGVGGRGVAAHHSR